MWEYFYEPLVAMRDRIAGQPSCMSSQVFGVMKLYFATFPDFRSPANSV